MKERKTYQLLLNLAPQNMELVGEEIIDLEQGRGVSRSIYESWCNLEANRKYGEQYNGWDPMTGQPCESDEEFRERLKILGYL